MGEGSDYLFHCLFLDNIILFGQERGEGRVALFRGMGAWCRECGDGSNFFYENLFSKIFFIL